jgi:hypothetical protein
MSVGFDRRRAFQGSNDTSSSSTATATGTATPQRNQWTILFILFPLALLLYVWNSVQEEHELLDPRDMIAKTKQTQKQALWDRGPNVTDDDGNVDDTTTSMNVDIDSGLDAAFGSPMMEQDMPMTGLWIQVESWHEGISSWKRAFSEVWIMAERLGAVLVEPGIRDGRLSSCGKGKLALSDVYNRTLLTNEYSQLATCSQYDAAMNQLSVPKILDVCLNKDTFMGCTTPEGVDLESEYRLQTSESLDQALAQILSQPNTMVVIRLHNVWKSALDKFTLPVALASPKYPNEEQQQRLPLMDKEKAKRFQETSYKIVDQHYTFLSAQLEAAGIPASSHAVIHWRAELPNLDYAVCRDQIVQTRKAMNLPPMTPFFLISSLSSLDPELSWKGAQKLADKDQTSSQQALTSLLDDHHFLRLENIIVPSLQDSVLYAVMDLILAETAFSFATCSDRCHDTSFASCESCNFVGSFSKLAMRMRGDASNTFPCWPESSSELQDIQHLWHPK